MANDLGTVAGDDMDVDMDIDLGPIDEIQVEEFNHPVRRLYSNHGHFLISVLTLLSRISISPALQSQLTRSTVLTTFSDQALDLRLNSRLTKSTYTD